MSAHKRKVHAVVVTFRDTGGYEHHYDIDSHDAKNGSGTWWRVPFEHGVAGGRPYFHTMIEAVFACRQDFVSRATLAPCSQPCGCVECRTHRGEPA